MQRFFQNSNNRDKSLEKIIGEIKDLRKSITSVNPEDILRYKITQEARNVTQEEIGKANKMLAIISSIIISVLVFFIGDKYNDFKEFENNLRDKTEEIFKKEFEKEIGESKKRIEQETNKNIASLREQIPSAEEFSKIQNEYTKLESQLDGLSQVKDQQKQRLEKNVQEMERLKTDNIKEMERLKTDIERLKALAADLGENESDISSLSTIEERFISLLDSISKKIDVNSKDGNINSIYDPTKIMSKAIEEAIQESKSNLSNKKKGEFYIYIGTSSPSKPLLLNHSKFLIYDGGRLVTISSIDQLKSRIILQAQSGVRTRISAPSINEETKNIQLAEEVGVPLNKGERVSVSELPKPVQLSNGSLYYVARVSRQNN